MGNVSSNINSEDAIFNNFSNIEFDKKKSCVILGSQQRYTLSELINIQMGFCHAFDKKNAIAVGANFYGISEYREQKLSLSYARRIKKSLSLSVNFDYNQIIINELGQKIFFSYGIGLSNKINEALSYTVYLFNFENTSITPQSEANTYLQIGLSHKISNSLFVYTEVEKYIEEPINLKFGLEYLFKENIQFRIGYFSSPGSITFGFSISKIKNMTIDIAGQFNNILGVSPSIGVKYDF